MPCMPRTTRVFGVVKGVDEVRVLRSGRILWYESGEGKVKKVTSGHESIDCLGKKNKNDKKNEWEKDRDRDRNIKSRIGTKNGHDKFGAEVMGRKANCVISNSVSGDEKMFALVYSRKRKRNGSVDRQNLSAHRSWREKVKEEMRLVDNESLFELCVVVRKRACNRFAYVLDLVLKYIKNFGVDVSLFAGFILSEPIRGVFAEHGMHFSKTCLTYEAGFCKFFKAQSPLPMFYVDISAIPVCLMYMHLDLVCRVRYMSALSVNKSSDLEECDEMSTDEEDGNFCIVKTIKTKASVSESEKAVLNPYVKTSKLGMRNTHYKNGMSFHGVRRRRSSLRTRRARSPVVGIPNANGVLASDLISRMKTGIPFSSVVSKIKPWRSCQRSSSLKIQGVSSSVTEEKQELYSPSCTTNMLVVEADRCYRVEGATVCLQVSHSGEWQLELKKEGLIKYTHKAQKLMRPCSFNRITHDIIWKGDERWKLEFPSRQEWSVFKDLYNECFVRNAPSAPVLKGIPVPGVHAVSVDDESYVALFSRPDSYISVASDEVERALSKGTANYEMDHEDEMWLKQFNNEYDSGAGQWVLSMDDFELIVDALEKSYFCAPDEFSDETALNLCAKFGRREVAETVYGYWDRKRKQKRGVLLRVFQEHQAKKAPLVLKPTLRKKRSFNRKPSLSGRGKPPIVLQAAITPVQDASERQNALLKVEEAKLAARRSIDAAIFKRQKAQALMENAQLASYKAVMALRIAELNSIANNSSDAVVSLVLE